MIKYFNLNLYRYFKPIIIDDIDRRKVYRDEQENVHLSRQTNDKLTCIVNLRDILSSGCFTSAMSGAHDENVTIINPLHILENE